MSKISLVDWVMILQSPCSAANTADARASITIRKINSATYKTANHFRGLDFLCFGESIGTGLLIFDLGIVSCGNLASRREL
jgi:hypothetical protein